MVAHAGVPGLTSPVPHYGTRRLQQGRTCPEWSSPVGQGITSATRKARVAPHVFSELTEEEMAAGAFMTKCIPHKHVLLLLNWLSKRPKTEGARRGGGVCQPGARRPPGAQGGAGGGVEQGPMNGVQ
jgi:hypothetical protein